MSDMKDKQLFKLITSVHFTPELFLHYLYRKIDDIDVIDNLVMRLYSFDDNQISRILYYLMYAGLTYFVLKVPNQLIERFLCDMCSQSAHHYFKIYSLTEAFGFDMAQQSPEGKRRIDKLLEAYECSMVNEDNRYSGGAKKKVYKDQFEMMEHSINKRIKNDFKDDVKNFFLLMVQPGLSLKKMSKDERGPYLVNYFERVNNWFYERRNTEVAPTIKGLKLMHGFTMPFENFPESNAIVRVIKDEFKVFETRERCPYMVCFETIDSDELETKMPVFKKDPDYVKLKQKRNEELEKQDKALHVSLRLMRRLRSMKKLTMVKGEIVKSKVRSISTHISDRIDSKLKHVRGPQWCQRKAKLLEHFILNRASQPMTEAKASSRVWEHYFELIRDSVSRKKELIFKKFKTPDHGLGPWKTLWKFKEAHFKETSPYAHFTSLRIRPMMVKAGDDLRQELLALNLIRCFKNIFDRESLNIYLRPYDVIIRNHDSGFIEFIPDTISIDSLKKKYPEQTLHEIFFEIFKDNFEIAQHNFLSSLVGYSLVCYMLKVRDRHNGNILLDAEGHIIHIDFGFMLSNTPGDFGFESAPFKLTEEYIEILGGQKSNIFDYFKILMLQGFSVLRKYSDEVLNILKIMCIDSSLPCFRRFELKEITNSFGLSLLDDERQRFMESLIEDSYSSKSTYFYDQYQKYSNQIES